MSDLQNEVLQALAAIQSRVAAEAEAKAAASRAKVVAFFKRHIPTVVGATSGYVGGHYGLIEAVLKHFI